MRLCIPSWIVVGAIVGLSTALRAEDPAPGSGTLSLSGHDFKLTRFVAYEMKSGDEERIVLLASDRKLPIDKIKAALREDPNDDGIFVSQPHVKVVFLPSGEVDRCEAWADNSSFGTGGDDLTGKLIRTGDRVAGTVTLPTQDTKIVTCSFDLNFDIALGLDASQPRSSPTGPVKPTVSGKFLGNGKPAKLAFVSAHRGEPFNDEPSIELVFTEKDHSKEKRPTIKASFGDFGCALIISCGEDGGIFGCQVVHSAHEKQGFSSIGRIRMAEFDLGDGHVQGQITTDGEDEFFGETWAVDLKFAVPLAAAKNGKAGAKAADKKSREPVEREAPAEPDTTVAALNVRELPIPKDATDIEYKQLVEQLTFKSPAKVKALATDLIKKLAAQGWTSQGADLITPQSAILNQARGDATLTIMLKPASGGSQATVFSTGLDWDETEK